MGCRASVRAVCGDVDYFLFIARGVHVDPNDPGCRTGHCWETCASVVPLLDTKVQTHNVARTFLVNLISSRAVSLPRARAL